MWLTKKWQIRLERNDPIWLNEYYVMEKFFSKVSVNKY